MSASLTVSQDTLTYGFDQIGSEVKVEHEELDGKHDFNLRGHQVLQNSELELKDFNGDDPLQIQSPSVDEEIDIKYELDSMERNPMGHGEDDVDMEIDPDGRFTKTNPKPGTHQSMNTEQNEFQELYRDLVHCDRDCEICLVYIRRLSEHVRATHVGGRVSETPDPLLIDPDDLNMDLSSSAIEIKLEEKEDFRKERMESTEESESNAEEFDSDPDFNIESESEPDVRNSISPGSRLLRREVGKINIRNQKNTSSQDTEIETEEKEFSCETCGKICMSPVGLALHESTHTGRNDPKTKTQKARSKSKKSHSSKSNSSVPLHICEMCGKKFVSKSKLRRHIMSSVHTKTNVRGSTSQTRRELRTLETIHSRERLFKCDECEEILTKSADLAKHKKIHSEEKNKPYKCYECVQRFSSHDALRGHSRRHTKQTRCACHLCSRGQVSKSHAFVQWGHKTGDRAFKCEECEMERKGKEKELLGIALSVLNKSSRTNADRVPVV